MKSIWKGSIAFGLVNIPIKLYSAIEQKAFKMRLLHKDKLSPIRYKKWCDECTEEVAQEDIVKGVEVSKGEYVVLDDEELKAIRPEKSSRIEVIEFIGSNQIEPIYFDSHYFAGPEKPKDKTYFLFKEALSQTAKIAIGKFVMREKEYLCAIESYKNGILVTTLNYGYEIRDINELEDLKERPKISNAELDLAKELIRKIEVDEFDVSKFKDTFQQEMQKIVKKKAKGETITIEKTESVKRTKEENLIEALKASLK
ncbi:MAG TPA: Ku protein [Alphaproteobacteria bacterium]|nr:Ku protein [Alphaproteobacteria bacterium]